MIDVSVTGFTFDANDQTEVSGADRFTGVYFRNVSGTITGTGLFDSMVGGFNAADPSATGVRAIGNSLLGITHNDVSYTIQGITAGGDGSTGPNPNVVISNNTVNLQPGVSIDNTKQGIVVEDGATGTVKHNTIGAGFVGILVLGSSGVTIGGSPADANTISDQVNGIYLWYADSNTVSYNSVSNGSSNGIYVDASSHNTISNNIISNIRFGDGVGGWGIALDGWEGPTNNNTVTGNRVSDSDVGIWVGDGANDTIGGTGNILTGNNIGLQVQWGGFGTILDNTITGNTTGIEVNGGTAMLQGNDLTGNTIGLRVEGGAVVDAGQNGPGTDFTGLGISTGGNDFTGYTSSSSSSGAIVNLNADPTVGPHGIASPVYDVTAFGNLWNDSTPAGIENVVYHDADDNDLGFVDYATLGNLDFSVVPTAIDEGQSVTLSGSFTNDPQEHTLHIVWGDGQTDTIVLAQGVFDFSVEHTYLDNPSSGSTFTLNFTLTDSSGGEADGTQDITVENLKPTAEIHGATSGVEGTGIVLTSTVTDPGPVDNASAFTYLWTITRSRDGGLTYQSYDSATTADYTLNPDDDGLYHVTLVATDKDGAASDTVSQDITVENLKPTAEIHGATSGVEGTGIVLTSTVSDPGPVDNASAFAYVWTITRSRDGGLTYQSYDSATTAGLHAEPGRRRAVSRDVGCHGQGRGGQRYRGPGHNGGESQADGGDTRRHERRGRYGYSTDEHGERSWSGGQRFGVHICVDDHAEPGRRVDVPVIRLCHDRRLHAEPGRRRAVSRDVGCHGQGRGGQRYREPGHNGGESQADGGDTRCHERGGRYGYSADEHGERSWSGGQRFGVRIFVDDHAEPGRRVDVPVIRHWHDARVTR